MNKKILIAGLLISVMLFAPINSAYSTIDKSVKKNVDTLVYTPMLDDTWVKTYDYYDGYYTEIGNSVCQTSDGGYIVAAESRCSQGYLNDWIFKTDSKGNITWEKTYTDDDHEYYAYSVLETDDNKYLIVGARSNNVWLLKLDNDGTQIWSKTYDIMSYGAEVIQTSDGGYAVIGFHGNICLLKTYSNGSINWFKSYGGDRGFSLKETLDGGYIMVGLDNGNPSTTCLLKTDENGTLLWNKKYNGNGETFCESVDITMDGGYVIIGKTRKIPINFLDYLKLDIWLLKTDSNGEKLWEKTFGKPYYCDEGFSVCATDDGGCVITGYVGGIVYIFFKIEAKFIKIDNLGNVEWSKTLGSTANFVQQTTDGGYILTGSYRDDVFLIKTDSNGNAPPLSKTKDIGIRNKVSYNSFLLSILEQFSILNLFLQRLAFL